ARERVIRVSAGAGDRYRARAAVAPEAAVERRAVVRIVAAVAVDRVVREVGVRYVTVDRRPECARVEPATRTEATVLSRCPGHGQQGQGPYQQERAQNSPHSPHLALAAEAAELT